MRAEDFAAIDTIEQAVRARGAQWIAIAGVPGSGKSTIAEALRLRWPRAAVLSMDGYHLPRRMLDAEGLRRRGAPHTFNRDRLRADLWQLKRTGTGVFPAFDHAQGDPQEGAIAIDADARPVFVEGLYLLLATWELERIFDLRVFLDCPIDVAMRRVAARHVACGLAPNAAAAQARVETNDRSNAVFIVADGCRERADLIVCTQSL